ncbi:MAG TPA: FadD3 family acyl-CoA ligase [Solirubrobacterales bacterium]|nr:FadD3 family acyl-CoA ligase [Solirubrobacterales bacterium]
MSGRPETLPALIEDSRRRFAERTAVADGETRLSYAELGELVDAAQRALIASGVEAGDRVCVWSPNTFHWVVAALGAQAAGAVLVTLNTRFTGAEALEILERTATRVLFCPDRFLGNDYVEVLRGAEGAGGDAAGPVGGLPALDLVVRVPIEGGGAEEPGVVAWDEFLARAGGVSAEEARERREAVGPDDVADILFTSGTTGRPKGAMSAHRQTIAVADAWAERAEVNDEDVYMIISPFFHSFGYKAGWVVCLLRGATIVPALTFDLDHVVATVESERVTILPGPPTIFQSLLAYPERERRDLSSLRLAVTGSAVVPVSLVERMWRELSFDLVITAYGLSEAVVVTMCRAGDDAETISHTSGCATADFEVRIADAEGNVLAPGEEGEIQLRGPNVMVGYLDDPEATRAAIEPDGWLHTGDVGHLDERGYLTITDRLKDMLTVGGFNVYPAEVENAILGFDEIVECAVVGAPDERMGEVGLAYVVARPGHDLTEESLIAACRERLANYKVPRRVVFLDELPHNAAGKVLKRELRDRAASPA